MSKARYCTHCGALLTEKEKRAKPILFDRDTGQEVFEYRHYWTCPNKRWWAFDSHDEYDDVPHGEF